MKRGPIPRDDLLLLTNELQEEEAQGDADCKDQPPLLGERETVESHLEVYYSLFPSTLSTS